MKAASPFLDIFMVVHPYAELLPRMTDSEFGSLKKDIEEHGLLDPIVTLDDMILDGRHRYEACVELGRPFTAADFREWNGEGGDPLTFVSSKNIQRRSLTTSQRAATVAHLAREFAARAKAEGAAKKTYSDDSIFCEDGKIHRTYAAAAAFNVPVNELTRMNRIIEHDPSLIEPMRLGKITISEASRRIEKEQKIRRLAAKMEKMKKCSYDPTKIAELTHGDCFDSLGVHLGTFAVAFIHPPRPRDVAGIPCDYAAWIQILVKKVAALVMTRGSVLFWTDEEGFVGAVTALENAGLFKRRWITVYDPPKHQGVRIISDACRYLLFYSKSASGTTVRLGPELYRYFDDSVVRPPGSIGKSIHNLWRIPCLDHGSTEGIPGVPDQTPLSLLRSAIVMTTEGGDRVLDPCCGSGSTGVAALQLGRRFVGIDADAEMIKIAETRVFATDPLPGEEDNAALCMNIGKP